VTAHFRGAFDRPSRPDYAAKRTFERVRRAEEGYARGLRGIARHIGHLARGFAPSDPDQMSTLERLLRRYSSILEPWAITHATRMLADVARRDASVWATLSKEMSRSLRTEIETAPTGRFLQEQLAESVALIKGIPEEAADRIKKLTLEGMLNATRASEIAKEILASGEVSKSRANLIARTSVSTAASGLVQARAMHVGSEGYTWRTAGDSDVRKEHRALSGKFFRWDDPPVAGTNGMKYHAGQGPNCRCWPEPQIPD
jgi:SPP1 gp7 family putative phage head morphogenesis protein